MDRETIPKQVMRKVCTIWIGQKVLFNPIKNREKWPEQRSMPYSSKSPLHTTSKKQGNIKEDRVTMESYAKMTTF